MRELIESAGLDGWLEGPTWGAPLNPQQLLALLSQMQAQRRTAASFGVSSPATLGRTYSSVSPTPGISIGAAVRSSPAPAMPAYSAPAGVSG